MSTPLQDFVRYYGPRMAVLSVGDRDIANLFVRLDPVFRAQLYAHFDQKTGRIEVSFDRHETGVLIGYFLAGDSFHAFRETVRANIELVLGGYQFAESGGGAVDPANTHMQALEP